MPPKAKITNQGVVDRLQSSSISTTNTNSNSNTDLNANLSGTGDGNQGTDGPTYTPTFGENTNDDSDYDGWPDDIEELLGTDPDDFNSKPDGTYDPNFDYSVIYEAPVIVDEDEGDSQNGTDPDAELDPVQETKVITPNEADSCDITSGEIEGYQRTIQDTYDILNGLTSQQNTGNLPPTDLLNHPNRNVDPLKTYIDNLLKRIQALEECLALGIKISCLTEKSLKGFVAGDTNLPTPPDASALEYEEPDDEEPDDEEPVDASLNEEQQPADDSGDETPPASESVVVPPTSVAPTPSGPIISTVDVDTQDETEDETDEAATEEEEKVEESNKEDEEEIIEEDVEEEPVEENTYQVAARSNTSFFQIIDDSVRIVASMEFRPLLGSQTRSPLTSGIIRSGQDLLVEPAAKLLELQTIVRQITQKNVRDIFEVLTNGLLSEVFKKMYKLFADSNGELFINVPVPDSVDEVFSNIDIYLQDIHDKDITLNGLQSAANNPLNTLISHQINDGGSILPIGKNYASAVIYYFIQYVRCLQSLKTVTEANVTGPQSIGAPENGLEDFIETEASQNANLENLFNRDINISLTVDEMNSHLINNNIIREDIAFSENLARIFKAIMVSGIGLDPKINLPTSLADPHNRSSMAMNSANTEVLDIVFRSGGLISSANDLQIATKLFPYNSETFGGGTADITATPYFSYNYYNLQEDEESTEVNIPLIYNTRKRFAEGNQYDNYSKIVDIRSTSNLKKLASFVMAERGVAKNIKSGHIKNTISTEASGDYSEINFAQVMRTYHITDSPSFVLGSFYDGTESGREEVKLAISAGSSQILNSDLNDDNLTGHLQKVLNANFNIFYTYDTQPGNNGNKVSAGTQSDISAFNNPNQVLLGRTITGLLFETNYFNNPQVEQGFDPQTQLNIFDKSDNLPYYKFLDTYGPSNTQYDLSAYPFRLSGEYYGYGTQQNENGEDPYVVMMKSLRDYLNSVIDASYNIYNKNSNDISNPDKRVKILESFFEDLGEFFWNEMGSSSTDQYESAMLLNMLGICGSDTRVHEVEEEFYKKIFYVLSAEFGQLLGTRYTDNEGIGRHIPSSVLNGKVSLLADRRAQDDIGSLIDHDNDGLSRNSVRDRLFGMWVKYCAPSAGINQIFDLKHNSPSNSPSGADIAIEDYELTGNSDNQSLGFGGGMFIGSGVFYVASKLAAGAGGGYEIKYSDEHNSNTNGLRNLLYTDIPNNSVVNDQVYHAEDIRTAGGYKRSVNRNGYNYQNFFSDVKIGEGFKRTFEYAESKLVNLIFKYADTFSGEGFEHTDVSLDLQTGGLGYNPLDNSNVFGSSIGFDNADITDYKDASGLGTNKFTNLLLFYSIIGRIAVWFPTDIILEKGTSKGRDDDKDKRRFFGPRWSARYAYVISNALRGRDIDNNISGFTPSENEQLHYDNILLIRNQILDHVKSVHHTHVACLKFLDTICQKLTTEIQTAEQNSANNPLSDGPTPTNDSIYSEHGDLLNLQYNAEQQKKLTTSLAIKLMTPSKVNNSYYLPSSKDYTKHQIAKMVKFFSQTNRNYLSHEKSLGDSNTNRSNRLILNVGIPNGLLGKLILESPDNQQFTQGSSIPKSNSLIKLTVNKINVLNPEDVKYIPKDYYFDMAKFVFNNSILLPEDPLEDYDEEGLLTQLSDTDFINKSRLYHIGRDDSGSMRVAYVNGHTMRNLGQGLLDNGGSYEKKDVAESILMNHLSDYYLKVYMKVMMGMELDEDVFSYSSKKDITLYTGNDPDNENFFMKNFYSKMASILNAMETTNYNDPSYLYEFNRLVNVARRSNMFAQKKYFNRTILPKTFDRVFSLLIDEGDFIPVAAVDQNTGQVNLEDGFGEAAKQATITAFKNFSDGQESTFPHTDGRSHTLGATPDQLNTIIGQPFVIDDNDITDETIYQYYCTIRIIPEEDFNIISQIESSSSPIITSENNEMEYLKGIFGPGSDEDELLAGYELEQSQNAPTGNNSGLTNNLGSII